MTIFQSETVLHWGQLDLPMFGLDRDLAGAPVAPAAAFSLVCDPVSLWFVAQRSAPAALHPAARPGKFLAELWRYDVAELFVATADGSRYFEWNLASNGAWWSCEFSAPREREEEVDIAPPGVVTHAELAEDGGWVAAMAIPLEILRARVGFGIRSRVNVTFILDSPTQKFLSAVGLPADPPDFHQPGNFSQANFQPLPLR